MEDTLDRNKRIHFIGIGGSGMYPLAMIAKHQGFTITGTDPARSAKLQKLKELGVQIFSAHHASNIPDDAYIVHSTAIKADNPELIAARQRGCKILHRSQFLALLSQGREVIAVSGTHGKTTTSSLICHILEQAGLEPSAVIGGELINYSCPFLAGNGPYFVIEADESDGSFLNYHHFISVVNNIDLDHLDFYQNIDHIQATFLKFIESTNPEGSVILNWDDPRCFEIGQGFGGERLAFGKRLGSDIRLLDWSFKGGELHISVMVEREKLELRTPLLGEHNVMNCLAAIAATHALEVDLETIKKSFSNFRGVRRRLEKVYQSADAQVVVFDDYAHNPGKVDSALSALRTAYPDERIIAIFQPHRYSRIEKMYNEFIASFTSCDQVLLAPVYAAGESNEKGFSLEEFAKDLTYKIQKPVELIDSEQDLTFLISDKASSKAKVIISLGAGDVSKYAYQLRDVLNDSEEKT